MKANDDDVVVQGHCARVWVFSHVGQTPRRSASLWPTIISLMDFAIRAVCIHGGTVNLNSIGFGH